MPSRCVIGASPPVAGLRHSMVAIIGLKSTHRPTHIHCFQARCSLASPQPSRQRCRVAPSRGFHLNTLPTKLGGGLTICNVTNNNSELFPDGTEDPSDPTYLDKLPEVDPNTPNPEMGELSERVRFDWFDLVQDGFSFPEDTEYWFNAPPGGWKVAEPKRCKVLKAEPSQIMCNAEHLGGGRTSLSDLKEGQVITGSVTELAWYHGIQVDIGAEFDGLIPVRDQYMWDELLTKHSAVGELGEGALNIEQTVTVKVHKIRDPDIYRWPVQLILETPAFSCMSPESFDPDSWRCPKDLRDVNTPEQIEKYFTKEEIDAATAKILPDPLYDIWQDDDNAADEDGNVEQYYYKEETAAENGRVISWRWVPVPANKEGDQAIVEFIRKGIPIVKESDIFGDLSVAHPWNNDNDYPKWHLAQQLDADVQGDPNEDLISWQ